MSARVVVCGMIAKVPHHGGATWAVLQYVLGLRRLGHDVYFVETMEPSDLQPAGAPLDRSENAAYFRQVVHEFGLETRAALILANSKTTFGMGYDDLRTAVSSSEVLINISGTLSDRTLTDSIPVRVYLDLDPVFNQLWSAAEGIDMRFDGHTHFVTVGQAIGEPDCPVPTCGLPWIATWQPVVLEEWPRATAVVYDGLTTVANWRGYGSIEYEGVFYGQKAHALRELIDLPGMTTERFMLALSIHPDEVKDLAALGAHGWELLDPAVVAHSPSSYRAFIAGSKGEFGVAKSGYVKGRCGWFSDRSACYLASGRPVLAQETGFSRYLPAGIGLLSFTSREEAVDQIAAMDRDYAVHARAARALAEEHFDSDKVLTRLLREVGVAA